MIFNATLDEVIKAFGKDNGYDGVFNTDGDCACVFDDFAPCGHMDGSCMYGYRHEDPTGEYDFKIGVNKAPTTPRNHNEHDKG